MDDALPGAGTRRCQRPQNTQAEPESVRFPLTAAAPGPGVTTIVTGAWIPTQLLGKSREREDPPIPGARALGSDPSHGDRLVASRATCIPIPAEWMAGICVELVASDLAYSPGLEC